jgi:CubicO group peptidase (beta-lactamase class C family)
MNLAEMCTTVTDSAQLRVPRLPRKLDSRADLGEAAPLCAKRMIHLLLALGAALWPGIGMAADAPLQSLLERLDQLRQDHGVAGVGLTLVGRERILWSGGLGVKDWTTREPMTGDTVIRIGSITKAFTAATALLLEADGALRLDDPVRTHLARPPYRNDWERTAPVTIAQLLEHTAGFADLTKEEFDHSDPTLTLEQGFELRPDAHVTRWKPGLHAVYSNFGYGVAGLAIEHAGRARYEEQVLTRLVDPLDMRSTGFLLDDALRARLATGYDTDGRTPIRYWHMILRPFGGLNSTPRDMAALVQMLLNRGEHGGRRVLPAEAIARMEAPRTSLAARSGLAFGYGLGINQAYRRGALLYGHGGDGDGYLAQFGYSREAGLGYFVVINAFKHDTLRAMRREIERYIVRGLPAARPVPPAALSAQTLQRYVGEYEPAAWRFPWAPPAPGTRLRVERSGDRLFSVTPEGERAELIPVNARHFRREDEPAATSAFVEDENGALYFEEDEAWRKVEFGEG